MVITLGVDTGQPEPIHPSARGRIRKVLALSFIFEVIIGWAPVNTVIQVEIHKVKLSK
jgi:hypothetical protein